MTVQIPWAPGALFLRLLCRLGEPRPDGADVDTNPDLMTQTGTVTLTCDTSRIRYPEADGRKRMLSMGEHTFSIRASDGELYSPESGAVGVEVLSSLTPGIDPTAFTWTAKVKPTSGEPWQVTIPADAVGTVDLVEVAEGGAPSAGVSSLAARVAALEAQPSGGGYPVQQVTLTGNLAYSLPADAPADQVVSVVFTQTTGGHTVTYGPDTLAIDTDPGASTLVEIWPGGEVTYPGAVGSGGGVTDHGLLTGLGDDDHSAVYARFTIGASGPAVPRAGDFWMVTP